MELCGKLELNSQDQSSCYICSNPMPLINKTNHPPNKPKKFSIKNSTIKHQRTLTTVNNKKCFTFGQSQHQNTIGENGQNLANQLKLQLNITQQPSRHMPKQHIKSFSNHDKPKYCLKKNPSNDSKKTQINKSQHQVTFLLNKIEQDVNQSNLKNNNSQLSFYQEYHSNDCQLQFKLKNQTSNQINNTNESNAVLPVTFKKPTHTQNQLLYNRVGTVESHLYDSQHNGKRLSYQSSVFSNHIKNPLIGCQSMNALV